MPGKKLLLFGTAILKPVRTQIADPLILQPPDSKITVPSAQVAMVTVPQANRDYYRIGVGIDLIELVKVIKKENPPTAQVKQESTAGNVRAPF